MSWILLAAIPQMLLTGLVQEGAKLLPVVVYWRRSGRNLDPKLGLVIGAVAGAGCAIFEARWVLSQWTWELVQTYGYMALLGFWERFFTVAAHISFSALAGYGLAKGWGWQFYLITSFLHGLLNYSAVFRAAGLFTDVHAEIYIAVLAVAVSAWALWLRWRKTTILAELPIPSASGVAQ